MNLNKVNKLLIVRLSSLGDILLTTPFIRALKKKYPHISIDFVLREQYGDLLLKNRCINQTIIYYQRKIEDTKKIIIAQNYDLIVDLQNNLRSFKLLNGKRTKIVKFKKYSVRKFLLVKFKLNLMKNIPPIPVRYASVIPGLMLDDGGPDIVTRKPLSPEILKKQNLIGFCPGSMHYTKKWPEEYFVELGNILTNAGFTVVIFGGEEDRLLCERLHFSIKDSINLCKSNNILQIAEDMKQCDVVVCNDSGLMHTACAAGVPVAVFYGSTVSEFGFTPYNTPNIILENKSLSCRPCSHIGRNVCPKDHFKCMKEIKPDYVFRQLTAFIKTK